MILCIYPILHFNSEIKDTWIFPKQMHQGYLFVFTYIILIVILMIVVPSVVNFSLSVV